MLHQAPQTDPDHLVRQLPRLPLLAADLLHELRFRPEAVSVMRTLIGATNGRAAAPGTIRGDFGASKQMNLIHGSDSVESANREIGIYFKSDEICDYKSALVDWSWAAGE